MDVRNSTTGDHVGSDEGTYARPITRETGTPITETEDETGRGIGASIRTENRRRKGQSAHTINTGYVYLKQLVKSDPRVPFGGIKDSGYGRELSGAGTEEFVNRKTIRVE